MAVTSFEYKDCTTEFGKALAEDLTGYLSMSGRNLTVVNQKLFEKLLEQNRLTAKGLLEAKNDAAKLGQVSGINALVYGTITTLNEEVRISVSIVKLPTLEVFGFTKSAFPLTKGIKEMLPCATQIAGGMTSDNDESTGESPRIGADCKQKNTCIVCTTNKLSINVKVGLRREKVYLHPNETKCWNDVIISQNKDYDDIIIYYTNDGNQRIYSDRFVIESCKTYTRTITK